MEYQGTFKVLALFLLLLGGSASAAAQSLSVEGVVTSEPDGETLTGVNVVIQGTSQGTSTDADGYYSITVPDENAVLVFSYLGFDTQEIEVNGRSEIDVNMTEATIEGEDLVVVGYGVQRRSDLTGAVSSVDAETISRENIPTASQALQGKFAGVQVTPESGSPGASASVRIRGIGTLNNSDPLYVVDNVLLDDISNVNTRDIESVEVLKDASATAIYGSRGANGVVIITTKQGTEGRGTIEYNTSVGWQQVENKIGMANAGEYAILANELADNLGSTPPFDNPEQYGSGTDWQDQAFRTAPMQTHQLSARGGTEDFTYSASGSYVSQEGIIRGSDFERITFRLNNIYNLTDNVEFGHNANLSYRDWNEEPGGIIGTVYQADPTIPPYDQDGNLSNMNLRMEGGNPEATIVYNNNMNSEFRTSGNAYINIDFLENFLFRSSFGLDLRNIEGKDFVPEYYVSAIQQNENNMLVVSEDSETNLLWENTLNYLQDFGAHSVNVLAGFTAQEFTAEYMGAERINFPGSDEEFWYLDAGESEGQTNEGGAYDWGMLSYLFRTNYTYDDRYLFTGTYRIDGSSRFGEENRYGHFPSVAVGWRLSNEAFMADFESISNLKLRASWGIIGNDKIDAYPGIPVVNSNLNAVFGPDENLRYGATLTDLANPLIRWEESTQFDIGVELGLLDDRLTAEVDYYNKVTDGILVEVPIPGYVGVAAQPFVNAAEVKNTGFDFNLRWRETHGDLFYAIGLVASTVSNEVLELGQGNENIPAGGLPNAIDATTRTEVGEPIGSFYGYKVEGVFQTESEIENSPNLGSEVPGDLRFEDTNGDGVLNSDDQVYLGSPIPDLIYGLNLETAYKNFDLYLNFDGQYGNEVFNAKKTIRFGTPNFEASYLDRWNGEGTSNSEPRLTNAGHNYNVSDRFVEDASFFRLRNAQVGYNMPQGFINQIGASNLRLYVSGTNLFTLTDYTGYSPQVGNDDGSVIASGIDLGIYPTARTFTIGLDLSF